MILEWINTLGPILLSWPVVGLIALLVFRKPLLALVDHFSGDDVRRVKFGAIELERVRVEVNQTNSLIQQLYILSMSEDAFGQLKKLSTDSYGPFWLDPDLRVGLAPELTYFKILGYIRFDRVSNVVDVRDLPKGDHPEDNLSRYICVTRQGHDFIALREQAWKEQSKG
ncbi:MAG TPA: hypothetical protein VFM05_02615 [Candidatus Saccharimonadales bacterium]|nr:hypothetical protein [Candidatus Saccharimonadales bacterium]